MSRVKVVAVSYLNTVPFIYGIERVSPLGRLSLSLAVPAACADILKKGEADIALIPAAEVLQIPNYKVITDYCIAAEGAVDTVALLSNSQLLQIERIYLDADSRTSVLLVKILAKEYWGIEPEWVDGIPLQIKEGEGVMAIGDKVFEMEKVFAKKWDLAHEWQQMTGLPFVFAVWVATTERGKEFEDELNEALKVGVENIAASIPAKYDFQKAYNYLINNIKFNLDEPKRESLKIFWEKIITPG